MIAFFYLIFFSVSECLVLVDLKDMLEDHPHVRIGYSLNDDDVINETFDNYIRFYENIPFSYKIYMKYSYCNDWVQIDSSKLTTCIRDDKLYSFYYKEECESGFDLFVDNRMPFDFNLSIIDRKNQTFLIPYDGSIRNYWYQPFTIDVYLESNEYFDEPIFLETINTTNDRILKYYYFEDIPYQYRPYSMNFSVNTRYFFKFGYKDLEENDEVIHNIESDTNIILHHSKPFNATIYLLSSLTCNNSISIKLFDIVADKNMTNKIITEDDIPDECKIDIYPDDSPQIQPDKVIDSHIPYSVFFDGNCTKFDDVYQGCLNKTLKYLRCPFLNNAVEAFCGYDRLRDLNPNASKMFIIANDQKIYDFDNFKHEMIVHFIGNNGIDDPEIYFNNDDGYSNFTKEVYITLAHTKEDLVSYMIVENVIFNFLYNINCSWLHLISSKYWGNSNRVKVKNLILDNSMMNNDYEYDQLTFVLKNETKRHQYQVEYTDTDLILRDKHWDNEFYEYYDHILKVPLSKAKSFGLILVSHFYDIKVYEDSLTSIKPLNITLMRISDILTGYRKRAPLSDNSKYYAEITTSGNWTSIEDNPYVTFTADYDYVDFHANVNEKLTVKKNQLYYYHDYGWELQFYQPPDYKDNSLVTYILVTDESDDYFCNSCISRLLQIDDIIDAKCATKETINEALKSINELTDKIVIGVVVNVKIDLTILPRQYVVKIIGLENVFDAADFPNDKITDTYRSIEVYGGIKEKVSYLTISNSLFKFYGSSLNVHTLRLFNSKGGYNTEIIETNDLIVDFPSHANLFDSYLFKVKQYGIIIPHDRYDDEKNAIYRIEFNSGLHLYSKKYGDTEFSPIIQDHGYIPYSYAETVCIIAVSHNFEFYIPNNDSPDSHKINITLFSENGVFNNSARWVPKNDNKYDVDLTISGEWKPEYKLDVTFVSFQDYAKVTSNPQIKVKNEEFFIFSPHELIKPSQSPAPNPTNIPTITPIPEFVDKLFDDKIDKITDSKEINDALDKKFKDLKDKEANKVIIVNADSFPFERELDDDQYIKPISNSDINYVSGNLNLVLPENGKVTVHLNEASKVNIKLKGEGKIDFEDANPENEININNNADINGTLTITVPENVKTVSIDSINLSKNSLIECKSKDGNDVTLTVKNIQADVHVNAKLNSINISDSLTIPQSAKIEMKNVDVKNSNIYYDIMNFDNLDSILVGEFKDPPKSIKINSYESTEVFESISFNFMEGSFEDGVCEKWAKLIDFPIENKYKYINCYDANDGLILAKEQKILIELSNNEKRNGDGNGDDEKKGLPKGAIIGIVIGVIVVIAVIVIVVLIVRHKKNHNTSSQEDMIEAL